MTHTAVRNIILRGGCLEFGRLCIAPLDRYYRFGKVGEYHVHCDDSRCLFSGVFYDADKAAAKFLKIGKEIHAFDYKEPNYGMQQVSAESHDAVRGYPGSGIWKQKCKNGPGRRSAGSR